jgi:hypothetical protein
MPRCKKMHKPKVYLQEGPKVDRKERTYYVVSAYFPGGLTVKNIVIFPEQKCVLMPSVPFQKTAMVSSWGVKWLLNGFARAKIAGLWFGGKKGQKEKTNDHTEEGSTREVN